MKLLITFVLVAFTHLLSLAQGKSLPSQLVAESYLDSISNSNIGPSVFGGRIIDLAVNPDDPTEFYVAYASGGLWHTANNGTTFTPIFDHESVITIGDIAVHWKSGTIYLGSGEVNSSRSSYAGDGIYKSTDRGASWTNIGLPESHHIGRMIVEKANPDVLNVAVLGHLYTPNTERGMYHTKDGGKTWQQTLYVNDNAGAIDLVAHPTMKGVLYAAIWERTRRAWDFTESGAGSGIYKSTDNGLTWNNIATEASGFPTGEGTGRIGLDVAVSNDNTYLYAILDNYNRRPETDEKKNGLSKDDFETMTVAAFGKLKDEDLTEYLEENGFEEKDASKIKKMIVDGKIKPRALKEYVEDANRLLFDTPVKGAEVYVTTDDGAKWTKTHDDYLDNLYNSYGYYFGQIRVNPNNKDQLYVMGVPILRSDDGGATWKNVNGDNVHVDHHALWINPKNPKHIINGNDGGLNISYDAGEHWIKTTSPAVGQFYYVNVDQSDDYKVYGGTQDNGVWVGNADYEEGVRWQMRGSYPYNTIMGGDGMQVQIDSRDNKTVYTGFQFGNYFRIDTETEDRSYITPKHKLGDRPYRWNWQSPILLSSHNQDIVYFGANKLLRSMDKGETFVEISDDLTHGGKKGDVAYGTLTTISESPLQFGLIYVGSDDGRVHVTKDGGATWTDISRGLPADLWISRVTASNHDKSIVYASVNGYRNDIFDSYIYKSTDMGKTWLGISNGLKVGPINVVKEDLTTSGMLYVGSDHGAYISTDDGKTYHKIGGMPNVPVHDLVMHESSKDLIIGTHGRSIFKVNLKSLQDGLSSNKALAISGRKSVRHSSRWGSKRNQYTDAYIPKYELDIFSKVATAGIFKVYADKKVLFESTINIPLGVSNHTYDMSIMDSKVRNMEKHYKKNNDKAKKADIADDGRYYLLPGDYRLELIAGGQSSDMTLTVK